MTEADPTAQAMAARGKVAQLVFGHMAAQVVATAVRLGVADLIGDGRLTAAEVARERGTDVQATRRLLRTLAALDLVAEDQPGTFALTPAGSLLRVDRPDSLASFVRMFADPAMLRAWEHLDDSVRTGQPSFTEVFGVDFFAYLKDNPELSAQFNAAMSQGTRASAAVLPARYDFGRFGTVVDVGGGDGTLLAAILREHPAVRGILFDTAEGLSRAEETLGRHGVAERCLVKTGDFFASVPDGGDLYLLKSVIHDWDDDRAETILRHCRAAMPDHGRLLIVEPVFPAAVDGSTSPIMYLSDLNMLVNLGGRERDRADFEDLCARAGFTVTGISALPPPHPFSLIEAAPAA
ncbi:acetylserotonin O-methyltransferase [Actinokineospora iranica]|uniref:Dimerisation domain-containing protein n=1 Tax=Actinokineospora iranica TaxID=1271860 RepID=A0A1G6YEE0_9PSEU|nr:acetylserotonin O-methyltransferase [Actinokineospora iranica]SDD88087.1 Dimerisation domain-containing protein [Actinokineospora iranica]